MQILPGLTTTKNSDWRAKIREIDKLGIKQLALFPTCLKPNEREELYKRLEKTCLETIPHVHLRNDVTCREIEYLINTYQARVFNYHSEKEFPILSDWSDYMDLIYLENAVVVPDYDELNKFAGLCVDFAHWEDARLNNDERYKDFPDKCRKYTIGCCHISAIKKSPVANTDPLEPKKQSYASHYLDEESEVDYMRIYREYLPEIVSIELENPLADQLKIKKRLESILD